MNNFLESYFNEYNNVLKPDGLYQKLLDVRELLIESNSQCKSCFIQGNGASAAIASHCALDFTKQAGIKTMSFNEASFITAYANDYGYDQWVKKALESYSSDGDAVILISSSGKSPNILAAAEYAIEKRLKLITFTGFSSKNPLCTMGDINFVVNSKAYNIIECTHMIWLTTIIDLIIGKSEYSVN